MDSLGCIKLPFSISGLLTIYDLKFELIDNQGPYSPTILKNILLSVSQRFCNFKTDRTFDWLWFSQSEVFFSNTSKIRKKIRARPRRFLRMVEDDGLFSVSMTTTKKKKKNMKLMIIF